MPFAIGLSLLMSAMSPSAPATATLQAMPQAQTVESYVRSYFADVPIMAEIAKCESRFKQFDKGGTVHRGVINDADVGVMQINEYYHSGTAKKLGIDLYSIQGNLQYARYLYEKEGTTPWLSSGRCWNKSAHVAMK